MFLMFILLTKKTFNIMKKILLGASALLFAASLLSFNTSSVDYATAVDAVAVGGTCCPGTGTCYPPGQDPVRGWWRSDGRPCNAPFAEPVKPAEPATPVQN
jgi:hypothetical protein